MNPYLPGEIRLMIAQQAHLQWFEDYCNRERNYTRQEWVRTYVNGVMKANDIIIKVYNRELEQNFHQYKQASDPYDDCLDMHIGMSRVYQLDDDQHFEAMRLPILPLLPVPMRFLRDDAKIL